MGLFKTRACSVCGAQTQTKSGVCFLCNRAKAQAETLAAAKPCAYCGGAKTVDVAKQPYCSYACKQAVRELSLAGSRRVRGAIMRGELPRLDGAIACVDCGKPADMYDHRDYTKPLAVDAVCRGCNKRRGPADVMRAA